MKRHTWLLLAAVGLAALLPAPSRAATDVPETIGEEVPDAQEEPPEPNVRRFRVKVGLDAEYDDNILNLRQDARDEFRSGDFTPDRFRIESIDDTVFEPEVVLSFSSTPENRKTNEVGMAVSAVRPGDNEILEYEKYVLFFKKDLTDTRDEIDELELEREDLEPRAFQVRRKFLRANSSRLKLAYIRVDNRYAGQLRDDDLGDRKSAFYDADAWELAYEQRLNRAQQNRLQLFFRYLLEERDYNSFFDERDSDADRYTLGLSLFRLQRYRFWELEAYYEFTDLESNTALIGREGPGGTVQDDLSSERDLFGLRAGVNWFRSRGGIPLRKSNRARFGAVWAIKDFTTDNALDPTHFRREDEAVRYSFDLTHALRDDLTVVFFASYVDQQTDRFILDELEVSTFDEFLFGVSINLFTGWRLD